jgi:ABC-type branched-subunit amino acid transport system substrate-binding protein
MKHLIGSVVVAAVLAAAAACSSSSTSASSGASSAAASQQPTGGGTSSPPTGTPIVIGATAPVNASTQSLPSNPIAANVAEQAVNAAGGINGHPLKVIFCDTMDNQNQQALCANQLINQDKIVALAGASGRWQSAYYPALTAGQVADFCIGPVAPEQLTSQLSFPCGLSVASFLNLAGLAKPTWKDVDIVTDGTAAGAAVFGFFQQGFKTKYPNIAVHRVEFGATQTDYSSLYAEIQKDNADGVSFGTAPETTLAMLQQFVGLGFDKTVLTPSGTVDQAIYTYLSQHNIPLSVGLTFDPSSPMYQKYLSEVKKYAPNATQMETENAIESWLSVTLFAQIAAKLPEVTRASFLNYVQHATSIDTGGITQPLSWVKPGPLPDFPRLTNTSSIGAVLKGNQLVVQGTWFTLAGS